MTVVMFMRGLRTLLFPVFLLFLAAYDQVPQVHTLSGSTMGTTWSAKLVAASGDSGVASLREDIQAARWDEERAR
jgi:thiamine biosynthesis lipoprotein ApbE